MNLSEIVNAARVHASDTGKTCYVLRNTQNGRFEIGSVYDASLWRAIGFVKPRKNVPLEDWPFMAKLNPEILDVETFERIFQG